MDAQVLKTLEYDKIKSALADYTLSALGRELVERLEPLTQQAAIEAAMRETTEAREILARGASVPMPMTDIREPVSRAEKGGILGPADLTRIADCLRGCRELKRYMQTKQLVAPNLSRYAEGISTLQSIEDEISGSVSGAAVLDGASPELAKIRKEIRIVEDRIKSKLNSILASAAYRDVLQENFVSVKAGRYVVPVKAGMRQKIDGVVIDSSGSGQTVFIEPTAVRKLAEELQMLQSAEEAEEYQILVSLTGLIGAEAAKIATNLEILGAYDFAFAKAKLSEAQGARPVPVAADGFIQIIQGRHPLLAKTAVPLDLILGHRYRTLVITGPNTGGKTVALKTVGLLTLMAQSGLHVPAGEGTRLATFDEVLADIGDGQSIEQSLSTFSSHMSHIASILRRARRSSLVLLDEIGTGTDPAEGAALAMAVLEKLHAAGGVTLASTHYSDVKRLADIHPGFINGRMDFDRESLRPLFTLVMGEAGSSQAFWIAERLGIESDVLARAREHLQAQPSVDTTAAGTSKPPEKRVALQPPVAPAAAMSEQPKAVATAAGATAAGATAADATPAGATVGVPGSAAPATAAPPAKDRPWQIGDSVMVLTLNQRGVVAELPDDRGNMIVFTRGMRVSVNHKRVELLVPAEQCYPEGYDLRVATYSWHDRKIMHDLERGKRTDAVRVIKEGTPR
ncbi:MAG: endonuclease MutS2 [Chloroflexota bacterium]